MSTSGRCRARPPRRPWRGYRDRRRVLFWLLALAPLAGHCAGEREGFLAHFVQGEYHLLGKALDSRNTYSGEVTIRASGARLEVERRVEGRMVTGSAAIEHATADRVPVLRVRFREAGLVYEETCLVGTDLDNYARITCHLYRPGVGTPEPGLEALFAIREAR